MIHSLRSPDQQPGNRGRTLVIVLLVIVVVAVGSFLYLRPDSSGPGHSETKTTMKH